MKDNFEELIKVAEELAGKSSKYPEITYRTVLDYLLRSTETSASTSNQPSSIQIDRKVSIRALKAKIKLNNKNEITLLAGYYLTDYLGNKHFSNKQILEQWKMMQEGGYNSSYADRCERAGWFYPEDRRTHIWSLIEEGRNRAIELLEEKDEKKT